MSYSTTLCNGELAATITTMTSSTTSTLSPWKRYGDSLRSHRGHIMCDSPSFTEDTEQWVALSVTRSREHNEWELRVWLGNLGKPQVFQFRTQSEAKQVGVFVAQAVAKRYDGRKIPTRDLYLVESFVTEVVGAASLYVAFPDLRDEDDVKRMAKVGIEVTL